LGIVIGIVSVVVMLGIGKGAEKKLMDDLGSLAKNQIQIYSSPKEGVKNLPLTTETMRYIEKVFPELSQKIGYEAYHYEKMPVKNKYGENEMLYLYGVPATWFSNTDKELLYGSFFTSKQYDTSGQVIVINESVYQYYLKGKQPIGEKITIGGKTFAVLGVVKITPEESKYGSLPYYAWIPYSTFSSKFPNESNLNSFTVYLDATSDNEVWQKRISYALMKYYGIAHVSKFPFTVVSFSKYVDQMKEQQKMMNYLLLTIGSISLLVGGIGVMNIMLVSVTERTKEI
jgi:putative ABC transport system permease protein